MMFLVLRLVNYTNRSVCVLPGYQMILSAVNVSLRQVSDWHRVAKAHMHAAVILLQHSPGLQQSLHMHSKSSQPGSFFNPLKRIRLRLSLCFKQTVPLWSLSV